MCVVSRTTFSLPDFVFSSLSLSQMSKGGMLQNDLDTGHVRSVNS